MFRRNPRKHGLYYLLPGMSRANREKQKKIFWISIVVGILTAAGIGLLIWFVNRTPVP